MSEALALRPMRFGEVVDETFRCYRRSFLLLFGIAAVPYVPAMVLMSLAQAEMARAPGEGAAFPEAFPNVGMTAGAYGLGWLLLVFAAVIAQAAIIKAVSDRYLGTPATIGSSYRFVFSRIGALLLTLVLSGLLVMAGLICCLVPGIIFGFWIAFVEPVLLIEGHKNTRAIERSHYLIGQGVWARYALITFLVGVIAQIAQGALSMPLQMLGTALHIPGLVVTGGFFNGLVQAAVTPIGQVAIVLLYYDSRMRKEGFDLEMLARDLGERAAMVEAEVLEPPQLPPEPPQSPPEPPQPPPPPPPPGTEAA